MSSLEQRGAPSAPCIGNPVQSIAAPQDILHKQVFQHRERNGRGIASSFNKRCRALANKQRLSHLARLCNKSRQRGNPKFKITSQHQNNCTYLLFSAQLEENHFISCKKIEVRPTTTRRKLRFFSAATRTRQTQPHEHTTHIENAQARARATKIHRCHKSKARTTPSTKKTWQCARKSKNKRKM